MNITPPTNYRKLEGLSASNIKLFAKNKLQFYREVVLKEKRREKTSDALSLGSMIDFCLSDCLGSWQEFEQRFDEKFILLSVKKGSGQMFLLSDLLYEYTLRDMDEEENITSSFSERFEEAFTKLQEQDKFKGKKLEWALDQFKDSDAEIYFSENLKAIDKIAIDQWMLDKGKSIIENTIYDDNVKYLFESNEDIKNLGKYIIQWNFQGYNAKSELDNLSINHSTKEIVITEIKSTWSVEDEGFARTYLKLRYDIAAIYYVLAVESLLGSQYPDYRIKFQFLVVDTSPQGLRPLIYTVSEEDLNKALNGFTTKSGYRYQGLQELIDEIKWCSETQNWNISEKAFKNNGILNLEINYE